MNSETSITMNISLPEPLKRYVDDRVATGIYGSASEFVREAIREKLQREQERRDAKEALAAQLLQGLESGKPIPFREDYAAHKKSRLLSKLGRKNGKS
jgi:antitoxin ParD1/3/4